MAGRTGNLNASAQLELSYEWDRSQLALSDGPREQLTSEQEQAVSTRSGSLLLAAGAGSGKTSVLVERFVRAVREDQIAPGQILAITFTERAAGELRERVRERFLELGARDSARDAEGAFVSTFHSFCARLLRVHPLQAGVEPGFQILDEGFADRLRLMAFGDALAALLDKERSAAVDLVAAYGVDPLRSIVLGAYAQLRSEGLSEPRLPTLNNTPTVFALDGSQTDRLQIAAEQAHALIDELLTRFGTLYAQRKRARGALDFDDLELSARGLLAKGAAVRNAWSERFELLMVDEFQDSNPRQLQVLAALDRDNLFTVGDQLQSIYGFRHADVQLFRERHAGLQAGGRSLALTRNFRSRPDILTAVQRIFADRIGEHFTPLAATRPRQADDQPIVELLLTDKRGWEPPSKQDRLAGLPAATAWRQAEARFLAKRIARLIADGQVEVGEIVVLLRALGDLPLYESALHAHELPTLAGVGGFWSHQQVGDLIAWLRTLANPYDELALYATLASPLVGLSSDALASIATLAHARKEAIWQSLGENATALETALTGDDHKRLVGFCELFAEERKHAALRPLAQLLRRAVLATGYDAHVLSLDWGERRLANVYKLIGLARRFESQQGRDLRAFLDHLAHLENGVGREADAPISDQVDAIRLMSIHAAKGLEFPVVCVADLGREPNLRTPELIVDGSRIGLRLVELTKLEPTSVFDYDQLREERRSAQEEEEDRVLYVACTRAKDRLLLSGAAAFDRWPAVKPGVAPIAWLAPALVPDAVGLAASELVNDQLTLDGSDGLRVRCSFNTACKSDTACKSASEAVSSGAPTKSLPSQDARPAVVAPEEPGPLRNSPRPLRDSPGPLRNPSGPLTDPDSTVSYTSLAELERCGYRYYLEQVLGFPENHAAARSVRGEGRIEARARGTIIHRLLGSIDFACPRTPSRADVERVADQIGARASAVELGEIAELIARALNAKPALALSTEKHLRHEHPFAFSLGASEPLVTGTLDLIVKREDRSSLIVDYKSDHLEGNEDLERLVERDYGLQRLLYGLAVLQSGAREVEIAYWFLEKPEQWVTLRFHSDEQSHLRKRLLDRIAQIRVSGFAVTNEPHRGICLTCPGRQGLCSWGETHTMSERSATLESPDQGGRLID